MPPLREGAIGILPAGALGVSLFYHLTRQLRNVDQRVYFLARAGSVSGRTLSAQHKLRIEDGQGIHEVGAAELFKPDILACTAQGALPEVLIIGPNPDQLLGVITTFVELL